MRNSPCLGLAVTVALCGITSCRGSDDVKSPAQLQPEVARCGDTEKCRGELNKQIAEMFDRQFVVDGYTFAFTEGHPTLEVSFSLTEKYEYWPQRFQLFDEKVEKLTGVRATAAMYVAASQIVGVPPDRIHLSVTSQPGPAHSDPCVVSSSWNGESPNLVAVEPYGCLDDPGDSYAPLDINVAALQAPIVIDVKTHSGVLDRIRDFVTQRFSGEPRKVIPTQGEQWLDLEVVGLRKEVIEAHDYWERLNLTFAATRADKTKPWKILTWYRGFYASKGAKPQSGAYSSMMPSYREDLERYVAYLAEDIRTGTASP